MAYSAYELTAGTSALQAVESLMTNRTNEGTFDTTTTPTLAQVERFLTWGSTDVAVMLTSYGYAQSQTDTDVLALLERYNVYAACANVELTHPSAGGGFMQEEPTSRLSVFLSWKRDAEKMFQSDAFRQLGASRTQGVTIGGISQSDKETIEDDSDFEPYRFSGDMFDHPATRALQEDRAQ